MIIAKFGGTSVSTPQSIQAICSIIKKEKKRQPVIVVSALCTITDTLLALIHCTESERQKHFTIIKKIHHALYTQVLPLKKQKIVQRYIDDCIQEMQNILAENIQTKAQEDIMLSYGEKMSSCFIAHVLQYQRIPAEQVIATKLIITNDTFGSAEFLPAMTKKNVKKNLLPLLKNGIVPVVTGFIGATKNGHTTTLGRGGSDYTASIIGYALQAKEIQIWTDVDGMYSADPRVVKDARFLSKISYREASEMATFGAKILHPRTIHPAISANIPVKILNTLHPEHPGTLVQKTKQTDADIAVVTCKKQTPLITLYATDMLFRKGFLSRIFDVFTKHHISVDLVSVSEVSVSVTLDNTNNLSEAIHTLEKFTSVTKIDNHGVVAIIGEHIVGVSHILPNIFSLLEENNIRVHMISYGATDINVSLVIPSDTIPAAVQILHDALVLKKSQRLL